MDSNFIPGIYNWCDRWCERCSFTSRCRVYEKTENTSNSEPEEFWENLSQSFQETIDLLKNTAEEFGINLDEIEEEMPLEEEEEEEYKVGEEPLYQITNSYLKTARAWLESDSFKAFISKLEEKGELGLITISEAEDKVIALSEAVEVIHWYLFFIHVKSSRALKEKQEDFWDEYPESEKSYNGTAKITKIAIERSMQAWIHLLNQMQEDQDRIVEILALLEKSRKLLEKEFPNLDQFIRPGFDEE